MSSKGAYVLIIKLPERQDILVGSLGAIHFEKGYYVYIGSALGGFKSRLNRHIRKDKIPKWHVDYLLQKASLECIITCKTAERVECAIAACLQEEYDSIPGFGSSDCDCPGHLFYGDRDMRAHVMCSLVTLGLEPDIKEI